MNDMREVLFGDLPIRRWAGSGGEEPWSCFAQAADQADAGDAQGAAVTLHAILARPGLESRHYLQAWHALRGFGEQVPAEQSKHVYGVVIEMPVSGGWDTLAAYEDGSCRYLNYNGGVIVWDDADDPRVGGHRVRMLELSQGIVAQIGPWEGPLPPLGEGQLRLSFLCPGGIHFGQGPVDALAAEPAANALITAGVGLLQELTTRAQQSG